MSIMRVHYRERQRLSAADMRLEQDYRLGLGGRHDLAHHDWGIVRGLRIKANGSGFLLTPGIAIDGYGREIFVPRALALDITGLNMKQCWYVQLYYCEEAQYPSAGKPCGNQPAPRIGQRPVVVVASGFAPPAPSLDDLARARAAGIEGLAPWPVLVATLGTTCSVSGQSPDYALTRYARHRASVVRAPNARAVMQLGLTSRMDFYHFLLSTQDASSAMSKRIGIDRHDTVHIWRPLYISATQAEARADIGNKLQLRITAPMPAGLGSRARIDGQVDAQLHTLTTSMRVAGIPFGATDARTQLTKSGAALAFRDGLLGAVKLFDAKKNKPINFTNARKRVSHNADAVTTFSLQLAPVDATLVLKNVTRGAEDGDAGPCDIQRTRASAGAGVSDPSALLFRPAQEIEADPLVREVHAVETSRPTDLVPGTALRISGGAADDTDTATRVSIGATINGDYHAALRMDGGRRIDILGLPQQDGTPVLTVERPGTVYLPPIGNKDPLLPELLILAYIGGLRRIGNVTTAVTVELTLPIPSPGVTVQGTPLSYLIKVQPTPGSTYKLKRAMELVTGKDGKGDLTFRTLELTPVPVPATGNAGTLTIALPDLRRVAHEAQVTVLLLVEINQKARVVVSNSLDIDLDNPPH
jgi:hypothetical protein